MEIWGGVLRHGWSSGRIACGSGCLSGRQVLECWSQAELTRDPIPTTAVKGLGSFTRDLTFVLGELDQIGASH